MKILYVGHTYTVRANHAKIAALARIPGVQVTLVTPQGWRGPLYNNLTDRFEAASNIDHIIIRAAFIGKESGYFFGPSIFSIIARIKPDIIHVEQGAYAISYAQLLLAMRLFSSQSRAIFFTWWNLPYQLHGLKKILQNFNFKHSSGAIAGNAEARQILHDQGFDRPIVVLPQLGIDHPHSTTRSRNHRNFVIGYAGRITEEKGVHDLVDAVAKMESREQSQLYVVGAGPALLELKRLAAVRGISVDYHPAVRNEELHEHLAKMDVLVLPSRSTPEWVEQFGHILLEAMAEGVPVVGSSSGEIPNVIGNAGLIFPEGNVEELARTLDRLCLDEPLRENLVQKAYARIQKYFTHDVIAQKQFSFYNVLLSENRSHELVKEAMHAV